VVKNKHHYVPRFYLNSFASEPRRVHIFHLAGWKAIRSGGIKDQCYKHKLYGATDDLENILSEMEGKISPIIKFIINADARRFVLDDEQNKWLRIFIGLQTTRTITAANKINEGTDKLVKLIFSKQAQDKGIDLSKVRISSTNPLALSMRNFPIIAADLDDLVSHLLINDTSHNFVTSDNPVVFYNQYCERLEGGRIGATCRGLQIFIPLSPSRLLLLYDAKVYKLNDKNGNVTRLNAHDDVFALNLICGSHARDVILFSDWKDLNNVQRLAQAATLYRVRDEMILDEFVSEIDPLKSLMRFGFPSPNLRLNLSFIKLRRRVQKVPLAVRAREFRDRPLVTAGTGPMTIFRRKDI
jgi:hypothetical protein